MSLHGERYPSETSRHRELLAPYCQGYGLDIGFGGDAILPSAIRADLPVPYADTGAQTVQLGGDCRRLPWFRDDVLDYVYSSHVLEDFAEEETVPVLAEWARVVKPGGNLVLLLPDQQRYLAYCEENGEDPNAHHSIEHFSLEYVRAAAARVGGLEVAREHPGIDEYSFAIVLRKASPSQADHEETQKLADALDETRRQLDDLRRALRSTRSRLRELESRLLVRLMRKGERILGRTSGS